MANRRATVKRKTKETNISLELNIDGSGQWEIDTGIKMFDHLLAQVAQHGRFDLKISATGDDQHHLVEDVALCLGKALNQALGEKQGIVRMANAAVPMDDALAQKLHGLEFGTSVSLKKVNMTTKSPCSWSSQHSVINVAFVLSIILYGLTDIYGNIAHQDKVS